MPRGNPGSIYSDDYGFLSGLHYVRAQTEDEWVRLKIREPEHCTHGIGTVCAMPECIDGWQWDYTLFFEKTKGGRLLIERANQDGTEHDKRKNPHHSAHGIRTGS